ncbi:MAG: NAD(P)H-hydrate dehydratase [Notoacmeibacter sp.]|nr:NAD(P)H-hydrate dehydratase [Notoacmeibacter sp.]
MHVLTPSEMARADAVAIETGPFDGPGLMENAGRAIHRAILARYPGAKRVALLCGPGNNGGDGHVVARLLAKDGVAVRRFISGAPRPGSDAAVADATCPVKPEPLSSFDVSGCDLVVDALFGAGLSQPLDDDLARLAGQVAGSGVPVVAVDLPSGLSGHTGRPLGACFRADLTVTFFRKKPGHLLEPGRNLCGELLLADIGIPERVLDAVKADCFENGPELWAGHLPDHGRDTHKYARGGAAVFSGGVSSTGAARLAAMAAARAGSGAVTMLSPPSAVMVHACHLTEVMLRAVATPQEASAILGEGKTRAALIGPGFGVGAAARGFVTGLLEAVAEGGRGLTACVLDADALTSFEPESESLFAAIGASALDVIMTPHSGEFSRLFADLAADTALGKLEQGRAAAKRSGAVVVFKGPDTVIAAPDGRAAINTNATSALATAGSGDVLAGIATGLLAQGMAPFEAACAAVWLHGEAGMAAGPRPIAGDLVEALRHIAFPVRA